MTQSPSTGRYDRSEIAIIGMSGRFPEAKNIDTFWENLRQGVEARQTFNEDDLRDLGIGPSTRRALMSHPRYVLSGFALDEYDLFDAAFFGYTPREAEVMDPQHRLMLECAWEAFENAGYDASTYDGSIAVFAGAKFSSYLQSNVMANSDIMKKVGSADAIRGSVPDYMVTRLSYKLNLKGPACFVQTACSTSLVALHLGCQSLHEGECDLALAGGVSVIVPHRSGYLYQEGGMESPDGRIRAFDERARGTVFSSAVAAVVLKRLSDALADGDTIHAVIRGSATNNDGSLKVGFTAPSVTGQARVVAEALANAGVEADSISYVEAHGTGTELGDPIEVAALTQAYRASTTRTGYCALGSVKPNIGHTDAAAGVSSLIKAVMALKHRELPPSINFERPNPKIDFADSPFYVNVERQSWKRNGGPLRAGVSSFGFGGTNAHVIVEEAPELGPSGPSRPHQLLVLSAKSQTAVEAAATGLADHLARHVGTNLADAAYTLQVGRHAFGHRRCVVCRDTDDAIEALRGEDPARALAGQSTAKELPIVFLFPGQGSQYVTMGLELYRNERTYRAIVDDCAERLREHLGFDLREVLYPQDGVTEAATARLKQTEITQCALFVVEYATARLWMEWGIEPKACIGHSIGEYVAACLSGVLKLGDALRLVALRGKLMGEMPPGTMLAVPMSEDDVRALLEDGLWLATVNGPSLCVVGGLDERVKALDQRLTDQGIDCRRLHTSHAFHSGLMDGAIGRFVDAVRTVDVGTPAIPYISNVTGDWIDEAMVRDPEYWGRQIRQAVRFGDGVANLLKQGDHLWLEVGPGNTLTTLVRQQIPPGGEHVVVSSLPHAREQRSAVESLVAALGRIWLTGIEVDWKAFYRHESRRRIPLPAYPFERKRYWVNPQKRSLDESKGLLANMEQEDAADWFHVMSWKRRPLPLVRGQGNGSRVDAKNCLIFADTGGLSERLGSGLEAIGHRVSVVRAGDRFSGSQHHGFALSPTSRGDYLALVRELRNVGQLPDLVIHLWGVTPEAETTIDEKAVRDLQDRGFYSLLFLAQALGEIGATSPLEMTVVTSGLHEVTGQEVVCPEKATILGPCRVIPQEYPNIGCRNIDLVVDAGGTVEDGDVERIIAEVTAADAGAVVAYRGGRRWQQTFEGIRLAPDAGHDLPARLREGGVYLITGGLGGMGLALAQYLANAVRPKLVLTSRRGLPPGERWPEYLASHGEDDATVRRIRSVQALEEAGADVVVIAADAASLDDMRTVVDGARTRYGRIHGVVHAAGVAGGGTIQLKEREMVEEVLGPKVTGTRVLAELLEGSDLDFMLLCSSLAAVIGGVGRVDYCGANAYLDAFARHYARSTGTFAVSVNWCAWRESGMAVEFEVPEALKDSLKGAMLSTGISNAEGVDAFRRILTMSPEPQVAVSSYDVGLMLANAEQVKPAEVSKPDEDPAGEVEASSQAYGRPNLPTAYVGPRNEVERKICEVWQEALGIDAVGVHDNFFDLGGHSLLAVRVMSQVNQTLESDIPVAKLYEGLTVSFLSSLLVESDEPRRAGDAGEGAERRREKVELKKRHQERRRRTAKRQAG